MLIIKIIKYISVAAIVFFIIVAVVKVIQWNSEYKAGEITHDKLNKNYKKLIMPTVNMLFIISLLLSGQLDNRKKTKES
jgi:accessory gene regulator protein AgrB